MRSLMGQSSPQRSLFPQMSRISANDPYISVKEPYMSAKKPHISASIGDEVINVPTLSVTEDYISANDPYISVKEHYISAKEP